MYRVVGVDNREYGPIPAETVREWIQQGRANSETIARLEDGGAWKPLRTFDEFRDLLGLPRIPAGAPPEFSTFNAGPKSNSLATAGLFFACLGGCCCPIVGPLLAILLSAFAWAQIDGKPGAYVTSANIPKLAIVIGVVFLTIHLWLVFR
jgi:hypothetical protein